jgi:hypothetical protein
MALEEWPGSARCTYVWMVAMRTTDFAEVNDCFSLNLIQCGPRGGGIRRQSDGFGMVGH